MFDKSTEGTALKARFAGLGIAALASFALVTATPVTARAEEGLTEDDQPAEALVLDDDLPGTEGDAPEEPAVSEEDTEEAGEGTPEEDAPADALPSTTPDAPVVTPVSEEQNEEADPVSDEDQDDEATQSVAQPTADDDETSANTQSAAQESEAQTRVTEDAPAPRRAGSETPTTQTPETPAQPEEPAKRNGWVTEGGATYFYVEDVRQTGWRTSDVNPTTGKKGAARTYWLSSDGTLAKGRVIAPSVARDKAAGRYAYATADGSILTGTTLEVDGRIYIADGNGKLLTLSGTKKKGFVWAKGWGGTSTKERYYLYRDKSGNDKGVCYAVKGYSKDSMAHYTRAEGYVVRGAYQTGNKRGSRIYLATNKGKLASLSDGSKKGWVTSSKWGAKKKRYYLVRDTKGADKGAYYATLGFSKSGYAHYTTAKGYVRTKTWTDDDGRIYVTNKQGKMATVKKSKGWLESSEFVKGTKRYYLYKDTSSGLTKGAYYAIKGYTDKGVAHYTKSNGTVRTGIFEEDGKIYFANSKGKMLTLKDGASEGYSKIVDYGQGKQLYYLYRETEGDLAGAYYARPGFALNKGSQTQGHYTLKDGTALRGIHVVKKKIYIASKKGVLLTLTSGAKQGWTGTVNFGQGKQRYYLYRVKSGIYKGAYYAKKGYSTDGDITHYTTSKGYVLRKKTKKIKGIWYQADKYGEIKPLEDGKIGWQNPSKYYQVSAFNCTLPSRANGFFTYVTPSRIAPDATKKQCVETFIGRAMEYLGTEYKWDWAMAPGQGVDCAGLVMQCLYAVGMQTPYNTYDHMYDPWQDHNAENMRVDKKFKQISFGKRKRGDLIFYSGHVGIYLGDDKIINAYPPEVQIQSVYSWTVTGCSRVFV